MPKARFSVSPGYQITFDGTNNGSALLLARVDTLRSQVSANADLVAKGRVAGQPRGWLFLGGDLWRPDKAAEPDLLTAQLIALAARGSEVTLTGVPTGSGNRMFSLGRAGPVSVTVYDVLGREVQSVARGLWLDAGPQSLRWDGRTRDGASASAGVYFVRLDAAGGHWSRIVVRVR